MGCDQEVEEGCEVFNHHRSVMFQVKDAELVGGQKPYYCYSS